jgi:hypothetical protein
MSISSLSPLITNIGEIGSALRVPNPYHRSRLSSAERGVLVSDRIFSDGTTPKIASHPSNQFYTREKDRAKRPEGSFAQFIQQQDGILDNVILYLQAYKTAGEKFLTYVQNVLPTLQLQASIAESILSTSARTKVELRRLQHDPELPVPRLTKFYGPRTLKRHQKNDTQDTLTWFKDKLVQLREETPSAKYRMRKYLQPRLIEDILSEAPNLSSLTLRPTT